MGNPISLDGAAILGADRATLLEFLGGVAALQQTRSPITPQKSAIVAKMPVNRRHSGIYFAPREICASEASHE